jgi:cation:H+ antiporter
MIILNLLIFIIGFFILMRSSDKAIIFSSKLSKSFHIPEYIVSFLLVAVISVLPEASISIISSINGTPELGLGTLFGSNVADLTLVFGIVALFSLKGVGIKSNIIKNYNIYLMLLLFPILLGFDGNYSRFDGIVLIFSGSLFFIKLIHDHKGYKKKNKIDYKEKKFKNIFLLIISLVFLIIGAYLTVKFGVNFANEIRIPPVIIGLTVISIGTCLPELLFSIRAVKKKHDELALGDILGTVLTDATIIVGIMALIKPFNFDPKIVYVTGISMLLAGFLSIQFMKSDKFLTKKEGVYLLIFYIIFLLVEFVISYLFK